MERIELFMEASALLIGFNHVESLATGMTESGFITILKTPKRDSPIVFFHDLENC